MWMTKSAPNSVVDESGKPVFGLFDGIPSKMGVDNFTYMTNMDKRAGSWANYFHYKQFQFVSLVTERFIVGLAIADVRYVTNSFIYVYDIETDAFEERSCLMPFTLGSQISSSPFSGVTQIDKLKLAFGIEDGQWRVSIDNELMKADLTLVPSIPGLPLSMCSPTGYSGWTYTQKHNALLVQGELTILGRAIDLRSALASYDFSAGYMRRETSWRWASLSTRVDGRLVGLNLAQGVNETGGCENALWIQGERQLLSPAVFEFDRTDERSVWRIHTIDGRVDLTFTAVNNRSEKINLVLLQSNFRQFIGHFSGALYDESGASIRLDHCIGLTEDHFARW